MITVLSAIILGVVEGVTEFLPISSTGHLLLTSALLKIQPTDFSKSFDIIIQLGAISAVVILYAKELFTNLETLKRLLVAFIPTGVLGLSFYKIIKTWLLGNNWVVIAALLLGGILLILFEKRHEESPLAPASIDKISYIHCIYLGLFQAIAMVPGVSRSAATILGALVLGYRRQTAVEFSFLLAVPTMLAATVLDVYKNAEVFTSNNWFILAIGFSVSCIVALVVIGWLLGYIRKHNFVPFGVYRIVIAIVFTLYFLL